MALPTSREELKDYCLTELGKPVIAINVSDDQLDNSIDDALQYWREYHEDGTERTWFKKQIDQNDIDNGYITMPGNIQAVIGVLNPGAISGISASTSDNFFSFEYQFMAASVWDLMQFGNASGYFIANQYLAEMSQLFGQKLITRFRQSTQRLYLDINSSVSFAVGMWLVADVSAYLDPDTYTNVWGNRWLRKLSVAYVQKRWGANLRKFQNVQLPSGMVLNGEAIYQDALREIEKVEDQITRQQMPVGIIVG